MTNKIVPIRFVDNKLVLLDQRKLFLKEEDFICSSLEDVYFAIKDMVVRGAPAIGVSAAYGMYLKALSLEDFGHADFISEMKKAGAYLNTARPTAVNLSYAINEMLGVLDVSSMPNNISNRDDVLKLLWDKALDIHKEDEEANKRIGENMLSLLKDSKSILTVCNAGILATTAYGTATSAFYLAKEKERPLKVYACETRPRLQGARLTAYELHKNDIDVTVITDGMVAHLMANNMVDGVIAGCDRVASNGDTANKIGTQNISIIAKRFNIPFYIACPTSTIDMNIEDGSQIVIEERDRDEVAFIDNIPIVPLGVKVFNPAFDVTDHKDITAIVTERGILRPDYTKSIKEIMRKI